jgi:hypothetical protein
MGQSNWVHLEECKVLQETEKAILIEYGGEEIWLPRSQVSEGDKYATGDEGVTISITEYIAREKGIEVD